MSNNFVSATFVRRKTSQPNGPKCFFLAQMTRADEYQVTAKRKNIKSVNVTGQFPYEGNAQRPQSSCRQWCLHCSRRLENINLIFYSRRRSIAFPRTCTSHGNYGYLLVCTTAFHGACSARAQKSKPVCFTDNTFKAASRRISIWKHLHEFRLPESHHATCHEKKEMDLR